MPVPRHRSNALLRQRCTIIGATAEHLQTSTKRRTYCSRIFGLTRGTYPVSRSLKKRYQKNSLSWPRNTRHNGVSHRPKITKNNHASHTQNHNRQQLPFYTHAVNNQIQRQLREAPPHTLTYARLRRQETSDIPRPPRPPPYQSRLPRSRARCRTPDRSSLRRRGCS